MAFTRCSLETVEETNSGYVALADLNGDAVMDLVAGLQWFEGPSWRRHVLYPSDPEILIDIGKTVPHDGDIDGDGDLDVFTGTSRYRHGDPGENDPLDVFWLELVRDKQGVSWRKHALAADLSMGFNPAIGDVDGDGDADLALRGLGLGGRYVIGTRQTRVTLFLQQND